MPNIDHPPVTLEDLKGRNFAKVFEVAAIFERDRRTIRTAIRNGDIPAVKIGAEYLIPVAWVLAQAQAVTA
jgi:excisionase family DNA binding protein